MLVDHDIGRAFAVFNEGHEELLAFTLGIVNPDLSPSHGAGLTYRLLNHEFDNFLISTGTLSNKICGSVGQGFVGKRSLCGHDRAG